MMSSEESLRQYIEALEAENVLLRGRLMGLYAILADLRTGLTVYHDANATRRVVAVLKAAINEMEAAQTEGEFDKRVEEEASRWKGSF